MSKREVPKLNRNNFPAWKNLMKLHLGGLGNHVQYTTIIEHANPIGDLTTKDLKKKK